MSAINQRVHVPNYLCIMKTSNSETYLGDVLSNDGKIDLNIQARYDKGIGVSNSIFSLLQEISFGV